MPLRRCKLPICSIRFVYEVKPGRPQLYCCRDHEKEFNRHRYDLRAKPAGLLEQPEAKEISCLKCSKLFQSESKSNRLCPECNRRNSRIGRIADDRMGIK